jgi:hypothetical protein
VRLWPMGIISAACAPALATIAPQTNITKGMGHEYTLQKSVEAFP